MASNKPSVTGSEKVGAPRSHRLLIVGAGLLLIILSIQLTGLLGMLGSQADSLLKDITARAATALDERVNGHISVLTAISGMLDETDAATYDDCMAILARQDDAYGRLGMITPDGTIYSANEAPHKIDASDSGIQALLDAHAGAYGMVSTPYTDDADAQSVIMCAVGMPEGSPLAGVLYSVQPREQFAGHIMSHMYDGYACMTDQSGSMIHMTPPLAELLTSGGDIDALRGYIMSSARENHDVTRQEGCFITTAQLGFNGWILTLIIPESDIFDDGMRTAATAALVMAILLVLLVIALIVLLTRHARGSADMVREAGVDTLTGIYNHMGFVSAATALMARSSAQRYAMVFLRSDVQEVYGARYGYEAGRQALEDFARTLSAECESGETCARIEGGQFLLLLRFNDTADAILRIKALNSHLMAVCPLRVRSHFGIYAPADNAEPLSQMIEYASEAALRVMRKGDLVGLYDDALHRRQQQEETLLSRAPDAIRDGAFEVFYCPMRDADTGEIVSAQAVAMWHQPDGSVLNPSDYMPLLTRNSMMGPLNMFVLERICGDLQTGAPAVKRGEIPGRVLMHIARENMMDGTFISTVKQIMRRCGVDGNRLEAMVSASVLANETSLAQGVIQQLQSLRIRVCVDGFGGDSATLCLLDTLPIDAVRLSQDFVEHACETDSGKQLLSGLMSLLTSLNIDVYSCGALTAAQMETLRACGCRRMGYIISEGQTGADYCTVADICPIKVKKQPDPFDDWE